MGKVIKYIKKNWPALHHFAKYVVYSKYRSSRREQVFEDVYTKNTWADEESISGPGSTLETTAKLREEFPHLLKELEIKSFLDAPCGDFNWMQHLDLDIDKYIGVDIVTALIEKNQKKFGSERYEFKKLDLVNDDLPEVDAIFCRDCLVHLNFEEDKKAIRNVKKSQSRYFLTTTYPELSENEDIVTGEWRPLNLEKAPFNFPPPYRKLEDYSDEKHKVDHGKCLGVWKISELPNV